MDGHDLFSALLTLILRDHQWDARQLPIIGGTEGILAQVPSTPAGIALLDLCLDLQTNGKLDGLDLVGPLGARGWTVLVLSGCPARVQHDEARVAAAIAAGAIGALSRSASLSELLSAVVTATSGKPLMSQQCRDEWLRRHHEYQARRRARDDRLAQLSRREREVLELLTQGHHAQSIAAHYVVSVTTVRAQIRAILAKLDVNSQLEAVALANH